MLTNTELDIIDKVTSIMKIDWLFIDGNGNFKDLDNKSRVMSKRKAIKQVVEGMTPEDVSDLSSVELLGLLNILGKFL